MTTVRLTNVSLLVGEPEDRLREICARMLHLSPNDLGPLRLKRRALDARKPTRLRRVYTVEVDVPLTPEKAARLSGVTVVPEMPQRTLTLGTRPLRGRPVVVGAGPAGLFAAWRLGEMGYCPLLLERGKPVEERRRDTGLFWKRGILDPDSNVLFGEGGAGAFSDGKLTTRIKDPLRHEVLEHLVECGADESILYDARPHLGTDRLYYLLRELRNRLIAQGADIRFNTRLDDLRLEEGVVGIATNRGLLETNALILAIGHSARDTYRMLRRRGVAMEPKPFAVGVRVQHRQELIDRAQYGRAYGKADLDPAEYVLTCKTTRVGRSVYSFCMCPGGTVIPCASEPGTLCCNGMSGRSRSGRFANGAIVAHVTLDDVPTGDPLAGVEYQVRIERSAFESTGGTYALPMMPFVDFVNDRPPQRRTTRLAKGRFPRADTVDIRNLLPAQVVAAIREASHQFARSIPDWIADDAVVFGVETRTSAPVRIPRGADGQSISTPGLFPAGEGAGYAGGIVSAAVDGLRAAEAVIQLHARPVER